jgi:cbb3-type cytochrome oxidase maturation protein
MEALYIMIPLTLLLSGTALVACIWAIHKGQFDDVDTPPMRILHDNDEVETLDSKHLMNSKLGFKNKKNIERTNA